MAPTAARASSLHDIMPCKNMTGEISLNIWCLAIKAVLSYGHFDPIEIWVASAQVAYGTWCRPGSAQLHRSPGHEEHQSASVMTQMWAGYVAQRQHHLWEPYHPWETITLCHNWKGTAPENALISDRIITTKVWEGIKVKMKIKWAEMIEHFEFIYLILYTW